jgi:hypothetical protein
LTIYGSDIEKDSQSLSTLIPDGALHHSGTSFGAWYRKKQHAIGVIVGEKLCDSPLPQRRGLCADSSERARIFAIIDAYASPTILQDVNQWSINRGLHDLSMMASAIVGSPMKSCHLATGYWPMMIADPRSSTFFP